MFSRRTAVAALVLSAILGGLFAVWRLSTAAPATNVLIITLDTTRADRLGCYQYQPALTPVLDQVARDGVLFERAYSPAPLTLPSHATMFTGLYPPEHGLRTNGRGRLDSSIRTLPATARESGYDTGAFVASFVVDSKFGLDQGFTVYDDDLSSSEPEDEAIHRQRDGQLVVDAALGWLAQKRAAPFFCWVHLYDPHFPYQAREEQFGERFQSEPYDGEIAYTDQQIGRLLDHLKQQGLDQNTLVVIVGDHGEGLSEHVEKTHGYTLYESTQHVPWLMRWPEKLPAGRRISQVAPIVDLTPTLVDLLGLPAPPQMSGQSLKSVLTGGKPETRIAFAATDDPFLQNGWSPLQCLITDEWKYIRTSRPELYNLQADPHETRNLASSDADRLRLMDQQLSEFQQRLVARQTSTVQLTADEQRALESLGYLGGKQSTAVESDLQNLPDVKEMLPYDVAAQEAQDLLKSGQIEPAMAALRKILQERPTHLAAHIFLGEALHNQGQTDDAMASYRAALQVKPDYLDGLLHLGMAYIEKRQLKDAIQQFDEAVRVDPESSTAHYNLGLALAQSGAVREAVAHFEEAILHDEGFADVHTALGNAYIALNRQDDAIEQFRQEIKINAAAVEARINLAVLLQSSAPQEAGKLIREAVQLAPENPQAQYNLGAFLLQQGEAAEAIAPLTEAVRLMPEHPRASAELERAKKQLTPTAP